MQEKAICDEVFSLFPGFLYFLATSLLLPSNDRKLFQ